MIFDWTINLRLAQPHRHSTRASAYTESEGLSECLRRSDFFGMQREVIALPHGAVSISSGALKRTPEKKQRRSAQAICSGLRGNPAGSYWIFSAGLVASIENYEA